MVRPAIVFVKCHRCILLNISLETSSFPAVMQIDCRFGDMLGIFVCFFG